MTATWTLRLRCPDCRAVVTWENEHPAWHTDRRAVKANAAEQHRVDEARAWLDSYFASEDRSIFRRDHALPENIAIPPVFGHPYVLEEDPLETRYADCPACGGRIYRDDWASETVVEERSVESQTA